MPGGRGIPLGAAVSQVMMDGQGDPEQLSYSTCIVSTRDSFAPPPHSPGIFGKSGNIFDCYNWGWGVPLVSSIVKRPGTLLHNARDNPPGQRNI